MFFRNVSSSFTLSKISITAFITALYLQTDFLESCNIAVFILINLLVKGLKYEE